MTRPAWVLAAGALVIALLATGCSVDPATTRASPVDRESMAEAATKQTCSVVAPAELAPGIDLVDRVLVPYGPQILGVELSYADDDEARSYELFIGGYHDELLEAYDDVTTFGVRTVEDVTADLYAGESLGRPVHAALWRRAELGPPCDARGLVSIGIDREAFLAVVDSLQPQG